MDRPALTTPALQLHAPRAVGSTRAVLEHLRELHAAGADAVLAIVVHTSGSTYRKPGALALIAADGSKTGVLSGGCLEHTLIQAALTTLEHGTPTWLHFDSRSDDDLLFGSGSGCRGHSQLLLWPLHAARDSAVIRRWLALLEPAGAALVLRADCTQATPQPSLHELDAALSGDLIMAAPTRVWMVGAGPELPALAPLLLAQGCFLTVSEHRSGWREAFATDPVDQLLPLRPAAAAVHVSRVDILLLMSHSAETDLDGLRMAATRPDIRQIGLLGPSARRDALLAQLSTTQNHALIPRLHAPVGLRLGGEGPFSIALGISAWIQGLDQVLRPTVVARGLG